MDIVIRIISIGYALLAVGSLVAIPFILTNSAFEQQFEGISIYKVPLVVINSCVLLVAAYKAFKLNKSCLSWYVAAVILYLVLATYDKIIRYGLGFHEHIMHAFYYSLAIRVGTVAFLYYAFSQLNLANKGS